MLQPTQRGETMLVEVVHDINEFLTKIDSDSDVHYEIKSNIIGMGDMAYVKLTLYGVGRSASLIKCVLVESAKWSDKDVRKFRTNNAIDDLRLWVQEKQKEMEKIARELKATPGRYEPAWKNTARYAV